ncbi:unnamed protein product [Linum tenue]|uniref:S-protein homolog n=2 Tax=Linum tenue TaxID=586396 RepID=A0AAV0QIS6_9ROSI|nr:unnamed protein product [Linum tenue]
MITTRNNGHRNLLPTPAALLLLLLLAAASPADAWSIWGKTTVVVRNELVNHLQMDLHCKSREDDLGGVLLQVFEEFQWSFRPNLFGGTLFYCHVNWGDGRLYWFDFYVQRRDIKRCRSVCRWSVDVHGPCSYNEHEGGYDKCYHWNYVNIIRRGLLGNGTMEEREKRGLTE